MILVKPSFEILEVMGYDPLRLIERAGRTCYKSEGRTTEDSAEKFVKMVVDRGHLSVIEHSAATVKFIVDRGVTHELVQHRLVTYSQESTRYCNYKGEVTFVIPPWIEDWLIVAGEYDCPEATWAYRNRRTDKDTMWFSSMADAETAYQWLLAAGWSPQQARSVLPNSLKTEIVATANFREWRHIFSLCCSEAAHPQMREVMLPLREEFRKRIPVIFDEK